jgi:putative transposase
MPRRPRNPTIFDDQVVHVLNRGNGRQDLFTKDADFAAFIALLEDARKRFSDIRILAYCLMHNHWHLVLWPRRGAGRTLSRFMAWLSSTHVRRWRAHRRNVGLGHLYQGRFKSVIVQHDEHLLTLLRYVEANPRRARMVKRAQDWPWSSIGSGLGRGAGTNNVAVMLSDWPIARPSDWLSRVNEPLPEKLIAQLRTHIARDRPFGGERWTTRVAKRSGLESTLRDPWRPRKSARATRNGRGAKNK